MWVLCNSTNIDIILCIYSFIHRIIHPSIALIYHIFLSIHPLHRMYQLDHRLSLRRSWRTWTVSWTSFCPSTRRRCSRNSSCSSCSSSRSSRIRSRSRSSRSSRSSSSRSRSRSRSSSSSSSSSSRSRISSSSRSSRCSRRSFRITVMCWVSCSLRRRQIVIVSYDPSFNTWRIWFT